MQSATATPERKRKRVSRQTIQKTVQQIAEQFEPDKIILFGSYAYGRPNADSDVDLLVVMDTGLNETEQAIRICQTIPYHYALDLLVRTPETLKRRIALGDRFLQDITLHGKVLYERPHS